VVEFVVADAQFDLGHLGPVDYLQGLLADLGALDDPRIESDVGMQRAGAERQQRRRKKRRHGQETPPCVRWNLFRSRLPQGLSGRGTQRAENRKKNEKARGLGRKF